MLEHQPRAVRFRNRTVLSWVLNPVHYFLRLPGSPILIFPYIRYVSPRRLVHTYNKHAAASTGPSSCWADFCTRFQSPLASHHKSAEGRRESGWRVDCGERLAKVIQGHAFTLATRGNVAAEWLGLSVLMLC